MTHRFIVLTSDDNGNREDCSVFYSAYMLVTAPQGSTLKYDEPEFGKKTGPEEYDSIYAMIDPALDDEGEETEMEVDQFISILTGYGYDVELIDAPIFALCKS